MTNPRARILAIDDAPTNLWTLGAALGADFEVQVATSGARGLELVNEEPPDIILLDVMMPEMDGYETCRRIQADPMTRDIPIIFITAQGDPADETRGLEAGAADFITKPVNPSVLRARVRTHLTIKRQADQLRSMAFIDGLTGVANRRQFDETIAAEWRACRRNRAPLMLAMIDIDYFKQFNDAFGHQAGDDCLKAVASKLRSRMARSHDLLARYGGEEFVCLLPGTDLLGGEAKAEELRQGVQALNILHPTSGVAPMVTVSIGVAIAIPCAEMSADQLVAAADRQLYEAKRNGRNRICSIACEKCPS